MKERGIKSPYAVLCDHDEGETERVYLTEAQYNAQMKKPDSLWRCPHCGLSADWDDDNYENYINEEKTS